MTSGRKLGLLGGTFDPVHYGHLDAADAAREALALDEILFIPSHDPPHRPIDPRASRFHRFALTALGVNERPDYFVSEIELARKGQSYTVETLRALHTQGWNALQLFFILGADAFAEIATWKAFPAVLDAAHFVVIARPGTTLEQALARTPELRTRADATPATADVSTETRILLVQANTRDVSSTAIRNRISAGLPIDDLVPSPVARHIRKHHLYEAVGSLHGEDANKSW
jgi:nicotinate-nucleotide adenylyltransferase